MSGHKVKKFTWSTHENSGHVDPHFRELYEKINELIKQGYSQEEILKMRF